MNKRTAFAMDLTAMHCRSVLLNYKFFLVLSVSSYCCWILSQVQVKDKNGFCRGTTGKICLCEVGCARCLLCATVVMQPGTLAVLWQCLLVAQ